MELSVFDAVHFVADDAVTPRYVSAEFDRFYNVKLDCSDTARQSQSYEVTWFKDERRLDDSSDYAMTNNGATLTVRNVRGHHAGQYECRVVNTAATDNVVGRQTFVLVEAGTSIAVNPLTPTAVAIWVQL